MEKHVWLPLSRDCRPEFGQMVLVCEVGNDNRICRARLESVTEAESGFSYYWEDEEHDRVWFTVTHFMIVRAAEVPAEGSGNS